MRLLFEIDTKDYDLNGKIVIRPSVRSIIIKDGLVALVHSEKYNYYKFPGGGIEANETHEEALIRETLEESGLKVIKKSIKPYGIVHRIQKGVRGEDVFIQDNFYYFCDVENSVYNQNLDPYESDEKFTLYFMDPVDAIHENRQNDHGPKQKIMILREARVLEMLIQEGYFNK